MNAFQRLSDVVIQKSVREGFGLVVSEALWKETPVVAGRAGGIPLQMADGAGGILVDSIEECAEALVRLLREPAEAARLGHLGRARVHEHFLLPRLLLNEVSLMLDLVRERPLTPARVGEGAHRDPVCGMAIAGLPAAPHAEFAGERYRFCSETCRARFDADPERYAARGGGPAPAGRSCP